MLVCQRVYQPIWGPGCDLRTVSAPHLALLFLGGQEVRRAKFRTWRAHWYIPNLNKSMTGVNNGKYSLIVCLWVLFNSNLVVSTCSYEWTSHRLKSSQQVVAEGTRPCNTAPGALQIHSMTDSEPIGFLANSSGTSSSNHFLFAVKQFPMLWFYPQTLVFSTLAA